jgi:hypothetical protein
MKRSGNHAVVSWLKGQRRFLFFNNVVAISPILRGKEQRPEQENFWRWLARRYHVERMPLSEQLARVPMLGQSLIVSLEDHHPGYQPFHDPKCRIAHAVLLRDPVNLFASRIRRGAIHQGRSPAYPVEFDSNMRRAIELWKAYAREFLGVTNELPNRVGILFDRWFSDIEYRRSISRQLCLKFSDAGLRKVARYGGGSSFDGQDFDADAQKMNVLERHKQLTPEESALLHRVTNEPELVALDRQVKAALLPAAA